MTPVGVFFSAQIPTADFLRPLCQQLQSVPKSKFRQKSNQEKAAASKLRMEKRGEKLDLAKDLMKKAEDKGVKLLLPVDTVCADHFAADARPLLCRPSMPSIRNRPSGSSGDFWTLWSC